MKKPKHYVLKDAAKALDVPFHRVAYVIRSGYFQPTEMIAGAYVLTESDLKRLRAALESVGHRKRAARGKYLSNRGQTSEAAS